MLSTEEKIHIDLCRDIGNLYMQKAANLIDVDTYQRTVVPLIKEAASNPVPMARTLRGSLYNSAFGWMRDYSAKLMDSGAYAAQKALKDAKKSGNGAFYDTSGDLKHWFGKTLHRLSTFEDRRQAGMSARDMYSSATNMPITSREAEKNLIRYVNRKPGDVAQAAQEVAPQTISVTPPVVNVQVPPNQQPSGWSVAPGNMLLGGLGLLGTGAIATKYMLDKNRNYPPMGSVMQPMMGMPVMGMPVMGMPVMGTPMMGMRPPLPPA